jgi:hypothetical protein
MWYRVALFVLLFPLPALAAESSQVLECIKQVERATFTGRVAREVIAAVACQGVGDGADQEASVESADVSAGSDDTLEQRIDIINECIKEVSRALRDSGDLEEITAASACVGAVDPEETAKCVKKVRGVYRDASDSFAEDLAVQACARGNPAEKTAECIRDVSFHLSSPDLISEILATYACSR